MKTLLGIDVGTGSARAALFTAEGAMRATASCPITMWRDGDFAEHSSEEIWQAVCTAVRNAMTLAAAAPEEICGLGFDATCSLVVLDERGAPLTVSPTGENHRNVMVWLDHRAQEQAERINSGNHRVLRYVGGELSPEMQTPKLLWLKENLPASWQQAAHFFDLPDFLTFRATGSLRRSLCSTVCKWTYLGHEARWDGDFFKSIDLGELVDDGFARIGADIAPPGAAIPGGLSHDAAAELGLLPGTPVATSAIDAHAGGIGIIGAQPPAPLAETPLCNRLALICGTSSCHMALAETPLEVPGVWGPYHSAMVPGLWLLEGGQSATGALLDHIINSHARSAELYRQAETEGCSIYTLLNTHLAGMAQKQGLDGPTELTRHRHLLPYFHGNRSPRADASLLGVLSGLTLESTADDLALNYLTAIQAIACGTRHIIETMNSHGCEIRLLFACGGDTKNELFLQQHADILGCPIILPGEQEAVLLGSAMLAALAAGLYPDQPRAMQAMSSSGRILFPDRTTEHYHHRKCRIFHQMYDDFLRLRRMMEA